MNKKATNKNSELENNQSIKKADAIYKIRNGTFYVTRTFVGKRTFADYITAKAIDEYQKQNNIENT